MLELLMGIGKKKSLDYEEVQKLVASDGAASDNFGYSVAISADSSVIVIGAYYDDDKGINSGTAYVYTKQVNGVYVQSQKLIAADGVAIDYFGCSVAITSDGSAIVVGAYCDDDKGTNSGSVYVFTRQANGVYVQSQKLVASDGASGDYFGNSVAITSDGSVVAVGAYWSDDRGVDSGSAYVFTKQANGVYVQSQKLIASDGAADDRFGYSVAITSDGSAIVVGAYWSNDRGIYSGSAYVFTKQANGVYVQSQKLIASDGAARDFFGCSVAITSDGSAIVVGAYADDDKGDNSGSVYVFTRQANSSYTQSQKLVALDGAASDLFGYSVAISADSSAIVVGAYYDDDDRGNNSGSAYVFTRQANGVYVQSQKLVAADGATNDCFGNSVAITSDGSAIVVGAYADDDKGSSYIFRN